MASSEHTPSHADCTMFIQQLEEFTEQTRKLTEQLAVNRERRKHNLKAEQPLEEELVKYDSSFKKNNGLIRKLRTMTWKDKDALASEIAKVNQTKYVSEVVAAIVEAPLKGKDITAAVEICSILHQRYSEFSNGIKEVLMKNFFCKGMLNGAEELKSVMNRKRSCLRLFLEVYLDGVFDGLALLLKIVKELALGEYEKNSELYLMHLMLLTLFAKTGRTQILHLAFQSIPHPPSFDDILQDSISEATEEAKRIEEQLNNELSLQFRIPEEECTEITNLLKRALNRSTEALMDEHKKLRDLEIENTKVLNAKGELPENLAQDYEENRKAFDDLYRHVSQFAESLDEPIPELPKDKMTRVAGGVVQLLDVSEESDPHPLYDDVETREFYEVLPDLRAFVPALLLGLSDEKDEDDTEIDDPKSKPSEEDGHETNEAGQEPPKKSGSLYKKLDGLLIKLPNCYTRDMADELAIDFCYMNSKATRKRLVRALCDVPKACLPLLPFNSRIAAILNQLYPDIGAGIVNHLEQEFSTLMAKKDPGTYTLEPRIRNMRYMGELCKFKLINYGTVFTFLKQLLDDFSHMNIDAACALIETAGSYLIRLPETQARMENRLEQMNRLKNAKNLDSRHRALIDNAYYQCKPPKSGVRRKRRPIVHEYIRHLIFTRLNEDNISDILKKLRRLPWNENEVFLAHCLVKSNIKMYSQVPVIAALCRGLANYHDSLAVRIVDSVFEEIQQGMEHPGIGFYQHRVAHVRFLGELYNYRILDSKTVFETLYWILNFGRTTPEEAERLDPPDDAFRVKMVCTMLETSGRYFCKGSAKKKMDRFLTYFQRYVLSKPTLSMDIEFEVSDVFEKIRPDMQRFSSFNEANDAVELLESQDAADEVVSSSGTDAEDDTRDEGGETEVSLEGMGLDDDDDMVEHGRKPAPAPELDLDFEQDLKALLQKHQKLNVPLMTSVEEVQTQSEAPLNEEKVRFKMLIKRSGKDDKSRQIQVPLSVNLAVRQKENDSREAADRQIIKEQILASSNLQEEEEDGSYGGISGRSYVRRGGSRGGSGRRNVGHSSGSYFYSNRFRGH